MLRHTVVKFEEGKILTCEMLAALNRQSMQYEKSFSEYPDGIIAGMDFEDRADGVWIKAGSVKKNGFIYELNREINIQSLIDKANLRDGMYCSIVLRDAENIRESESVYSKIVETAAVSEVESGDIVIAQFQQSSGIKRLRDNRVSAMENLKNQRNIYGSFLSVMSAPYSTAAGVTMHPYIFGLMKEILENKQRRSSADFSMLAMLCQNKTVSKAVVKLYIEEAMPGRLVGTDNPDILIRDFAEAAKRTPVRTYDVQESAEPDSEKRASRTI